MLLTERYPQVDEIWKDLNRKEKLDGLEKAEKSAYRKSKVKKHGVEVQDQFGSHNTMGFVSYFSSEIYQGQSYGLYRANPMIFLLPVMQ